MMAVFRGPQIYCHQLMRANFGTRIFEPLQLSRAPPGARCSVNAPAPTNAGDDVMLPDAGKQDFQPASLGVGFQKGGLRPAPVARSFGPFMYSVQGRQPRRCVERLPCHPADAVTSRAICALMLSSVAPPVSSRPFAYKQLVCGSPQTKKSICLPNNLVSGAARDERHSERQRRGVSRRNVTMFSSLGASMKKAACASLVSERN